MALGKPLNCLSFYLLICSMGQSHVPADGVGSVPSTEPGPSGRTSSHSQMLTVCLLYATLQGSQRATAKA